MLALRQTPSHCDSVVHLHNVLSAHPPPTRGRHGGCTDRMANTCSGECDPPEKTTTSTYVNHGCAAAYIKILTLHCVGGGNKTHALRAAFTNSTLIILCQPAFHIHVRTSQLTCVCCWWTFSEVLSKSLSLIWDWSRDHSRRRVWPVIVFSFCPHNLH